MAVTQFTETGIIATLRAKGISKSDISDEDLGTIIADCLDEYCFYKPKVTITTGTTCITTVAGTPNYALPSDASIVLDVFWNPDYAGTDIQYVWDLLMLDSMQETDPSIISLEYRKMADYHRLYKGFWESRNGQIWLKPCPEDVYKVGVLYGTARTLDELDKVGDRRFIDLCKYSALEAVGMKKLTGGGFRAGQYQVSDAVGRETLKVAQEGLKMTRLLLANAYGVGRS